MNTALYSEPLSKCPAVVGKKKPTNPNGFAELEARRSRREQAGNMLVLLNGWWFLHTHSVPVPCSHQCGLSLWVVNLFPVLSTIPEKYHIHNSHLLYSRMAVRSMRVCGGAGGVVVVVGDENPESEREGCSTYRSGLLTLGTVNLCTSDFPRLPRTGLLTQSTNAYQQSS